MSWSITVNKLSKYVSPQWDHKPDQVQLALHLLGVLVNYHLFQIGPGKADLPEERRVVFRISLEAELELAIDGELPPNEETEDDDNPFAEFVNGLDLPEEKRDRR